MAWSSFWLLPVSSWVVLGQVLRELSDDDPGDVNCEQCGRRAQTFIS